MQKRAGFRLRTNVHSQWDKSSNPDSDFSHNPLALPMSLLFHNWIFLWFSDHPLTICSSPHPHFFMNLLISWKLGSTLFLWLKLISFWVPCVYVCHFQCITLLSEDWSSIATSHKPDSCSTTPSFTITFRKINKDINEGRMSSSFS